MFPKAFEAGIALHFQSVTTTLDLFVLEKPDNRIGAPRSFMYGGILYDQKIQ